jgi:hypothetical protein
VKPLLSPTDLQTKDFGQHPDEDRSKEEPSIPYGGGSGRHFRSSRRSLSDPSWVGAASQTALPFPRVAQRAQDDRHRSKREQDAPIPRWDTRHQQPERRGKDPVQGGRP